MIDSANGDVVAHVGGRDYAHSQYDFVELGKRPFGTAFLPILYTAALEAGRHPCTTVQDDHMDNRAVMIGGREGILGEWGMETTRPRHEGRMTSRRALADSKIAASVRLGLDVGLESVQEQAKSFGLETGGGELLNRMLLGWDPVSLRSAVQAYCAFSQGGRIPTTLRYISRIENSEGVVVYESPPASGPEASRTVCDPVSAYQIHDMMQDALESGNLQEEGRMLDQPFYGAVKTGTTHTFTDGWALGYNGAVTLGIWVGFHQGVNEPIYPNAFGRKLAFPSWSNVMNEAQQSFPSKPVEVPGGLEAVRICSTSGLLSTRYCYEAVDHPERGVTFRYTGASELLRKDREKMGLCDFHGKGGIGTNEVLARYGPKATDAGEQHLAVIPIIPTTPGLVGEDPYNAELASTDSEEEGLSIFVRDPGLMLNADILGARNVSLELRRPEKIDIKTD